MGVTCCTARQARSARVSLNYHGFYSSFSQFVVCSFNKACQKTVPVIWLCMYVQGQLLHCNMCLPFTRFVPKSKDNGQQQSLTLGFGLNKIQRSRRRHVNLLLENLPHEGYFNECEIHAIRERHTSLRLLF